MTIQNHLSTEKMNCFSLWDMNKQFRVRIIGVERVNEEPSIKFHKVAGDTTIDKANVYLYVRAGLYHGGSLISQPVHTSFKGKRKENFPICPL